MSTVDHTTIRPLGPDDWDGWWALRLQSLANHPEIFGSDAEETLAAEVAQRERFLRTVTIPPSHVFGAFRDDEMVGIASIINFEKRKLRHRMELSGVYVTPEARGAGIARRLIEACIEHARGAEEARQIHLTVTSHNAAAIAIYKRYGFVRTGHEPRALILPDGRELDEDLMVLMLDR